MFAECLLSTLIFSEHFLNTENYLKKIPTSGEHSFDIEQHNTEFIQFIIISRFSANIQSIFFASIASFVLMMNIHRTFDGYPHHSNIF